MDSNEFKKLLLIDKRNLDLELMRQANRVAVFGAKVEVSEFNLREATEKLDIIYSDLFIKYTKQMEDEERKVTKDYIVGLIRKNKTYKLQRAKVSQLKRDVGVSKARYKGMLTKTDMLQQYCFNYRKRLEEGSARDKAKIKERLKD
jgi:hypothetical protein